MTTESQVSAVLQSVFAQERISQDRAPGLLNLYCKIIDDLIATRSQRGGKPVVLGLCGSQGSGKSTMATVLKKTLSEAHGLSVAVLSLDDLYLPSRDRARLAREVHPLLQTRGVPGTHDVDMGIEVIQRLFSSAPEDITSLPRFDKALDERCAPEHWEEFRGRADLVIFEGWCVGAVPQEPSALAEPINALERDFDPDGHWRGYVNEQLAGRYQTLFGLLDRLLMLRAPGFDVVFEWRREQERKLAPRSGAAHSATATRIMNDAELSRFIMHYERLTRHILAEMPTRADLVVQLDANRQVVAIE